MIGMAKKPAAKNSKSTKKSVGFDYSMADAEKASKRDEAMIVCAMWKARLKRANDAQKSWWAEGREIKKFIEGAQWNSEDDLGSPETGYMMTTNNRLWPLFQGYLSNLIYQRPNVTAKAVRKGDEALQRAKVNSKVMNYVLREGGYENHTRLAISDSLIYGAGAKEQGVDRERGDIGRSKWVNIEDVLVDPEANTTLDTVGWVCRRFSMRLSTARRIYKKAIDECGDPLTADSGIEDHEKKDKASEQLGDKGPADDSITLYRIYLRGDDPAVDDADADDKNNETNLPADETDAEMSALQKHLEGSGNKVITIAMGYPCILDERPWPFVLDHDEFPITIYRTHLYPGKFLPHSPFKPLLPLQKNLNWAVTFLITQMRTMSQTKFVVDQSQFGGNDEEIEKLVSLDDREVIRTNGRMADAVQRVDFGTLSSQPLQMLPLMQQQFDDISGFQELFGGMRGARSATEADIREQRAQTNSALMLQAVEHAMTEDVRHMLQIMFSVTPLEKIEEIVGPEELYVLDEQTGEPVRSFWQIGMEPAKIRSEVDIMLEPGSTRRVNRDQEVNDRINIMDRKVNLMKMLQEMLAAGIIADQNGLAAILDYINKDLWDIADKLGWSDADRAKIPPEAFNLLPPPENTSQSFTIKQGDTTIKQGDLSLEDSRTIDEPNPTLQIDLSQNPSTSTTTKTGGASE